MYSICSAKIWESVTCFLCSKVSSLKATGKLAFRTGQTNKTLERILNGHLLPQK
jgi:hypothetical protein